jgi:hypothetical protein
MTVAFDYDRQRWLSGPEAEALLGQQKEETLALLRSPRGQAYLDSIRRRGEPRKLVADAIRELERWLTEAGIVHEPPKAHGA